MVSIETIRQALRFLGAPVVERPMPAIVFEGADCYMPARHVVSLVSAPEANIRTLCHELAHSQQAGLERGGAYFRADGTIDAAAWMADPLEIQAQAVEVIAPLMLSPKWAICAAAIEGAATNMAERVAWAKWLSQRSAKSEKPARLPGKQRRAMNAAHGAINPGGETQ